MSLKLESERGMLKFEQNFIFRYFVSELLVPLYLVDGVGHEVLLFALLPLVVVHQHLDQLVVHDLHVDLVVGERLEHFLFVFEKNSSLVGGGEIVESRDVSILLSGPANVASQEINKLGKVVCLKLSRKWRA